MHNFQLSSQQFPKPWYRPSRSCVKDLEFKFTDGLLILIDPYIKHCECQIGERHL